MDAWGRLDIWVNNAGADVLTGAARALPVDEKLRRLLAVDVMGTLYGSQTAGAAMHARGGSIINVAWDHVWHGYGTDYGVLFGASKGAVAGMSASLARQLAPSVRVNTIAPGWIKTAWGEGSVGAQIEDRIIATTPLARWGLPADIAQVVTFLASDAASFITGQVIPVNGGVVMR
jgi:3-oxoacyl-[acyl-carrier protein] reductase